MKNEIKMIIDCEMTYEEFLWVCRIAVKADDVDIKISRIFKDEKGRLSLDIKPFILGEDDDEY